MKSGKVTKGYRTTLKSLRKAKTKLVIISNNCPPIMKSEIEYYAILSKAKVYPYTGNNLELGTACGQYFNIGVLGISESGDSEILKVISNE